VTEELAIDELFGQEPNMAACLVVDRVLVRVAVGKEARWGGEEVFEWTDIDGRVEYRGSKRSG